MLSTTYVLHKQFYLCIYYTIITLLKQVPKICFNEVLIISEKISIDAEVLQTLLKQVTKKENKKRIEGSYQLYENGKARLYYILNKTPYRTTVEIENEKDAEKKLALFVNDVKKGNFINTNYMFGEFAQIWLDEKIKPNAGESIEDCFFDVNKS